MDVPGSDDNKLGKVDRLEGDYVVVKKGLFCPSDYYVPTFAIASIDAVRICLTETRDAANGLGWGRDRKRGT